MITNIPEFRLILVFLILNLLACSTPNKSVPDPGSPIAEFPSMSIGDTWIATHWSRKYGSAEFTYRVSSVTPDGSFDINVTNNKDNHLDCVHFDSTAAGVPMTMGIRYDPAALQFPLFVGKAWNTEARTLSVNEDWFTYKTWYVVKDYTTVKTEAGVFEAFLIKSNVKNVSTFGNNWRGTSRYWYAPEAKAIVKSTHSHISGIKLLKLNLVE